MRKSEGKVSLVSLILNDFEGTNLIFNFRVWSVQEEFGSSLWIRRCNLSQSVHAQQRILHLPREEDHTEESGKMLA